MAQLCLLSWPLVTISITKFLSLAWISHLNSRCKYTNANLASLFGCLKMIPSWRCLRQGSQLQLPANSLLFCLLHSVKGNFIFPVTQATNLTVLLDSPSYVAYPNKEMQILKALPLTYIQDLTTTHHLIAPPLLWESMTFHLHCCLLSVPLLLILRFYDAFPTEQP